MPTPASEIPGYLGWNLGTVEFEEGRELGRDLMPVGVPSKTSASFRATSFLIWKPLVIPGKLRLFRFNK